MSASHKLTQLFLTMAALVVISMSALAADPGFPYIPIFPSDQMAGNVLIYNIYTSSSTNPGAQNTKISITNTDDTRGIAVHLFFIDGNSCSVADSFLCLTKSQTMSFSAADIDPDVTGYIIAVATDDRGIPTVRGRLIGEEQVKFQSGHHANLGAEATLGLIVAANLQLNTGVLLDIALPRVLAVSHIPSRAEGNDTKLIVNRIGGDLRTSASSIGPLFGILFDENENPYSWTSTAGCQLVRTLDNSFPRTAPRFNSVIGAGQTGWTKFWATQNETFDLREFGLGVASIPRALLGAVINYNPASTSGANAYSSGHNLHKLTFVLDINKRDRIFGQAPLIVPIFPNNCGFGVDEIIPSPTD